MKKFSTSGTLGDTYITTLKLYNLASKEKIAVYHYTKHTNWHSKIKEIYSLCPNIEVNFTRERDTTYPRIHSYFTDNDEYELDIEPFPALVSRDMCPMFVRPYRPYIVINQRSGKDNEDRKIPGSICMGITKDTKHGIALIGTGKAKDYEDNKIKDLRGRTSLKEAFITVRWAEDFYGFQGLHCFVAMSMKRPTTIYYKHDYELESIKVRTHPQWEQYCKDIIKI